MRSESVWRMGALAGLAIGGLVIGVVVLSCSDDDTTDSQDATPTDRPVTIARTEVQETADVFATKAPDEATGTAEAEATAFAELLDVPVLSEDPPDGWESDGQALSTLGELCPPLDLAGPLRIDKASDSMSGPGGARAGSAALRFAETSDVNAYTESEFGGADRCAALLASAWFGSSTPLGPPQTDPTIADATAVFVDNGGTTAVVFFRNDLAVSAVVVTGQNARVAALDLATYLDEIARSEEDR